MVRHKGKGQLSFIRASIMDHETGNRAYYRRNRSKDMSVAPD
jgi:hypothetical protein